jgi:sulfite exporter TauE/SafE
MEFLLGSAGWALEFGFGAWGNLLPAGLVSSELRIGKNRSYGRDYGVVFRDLLHIVLCVCSRVNKYGRVWKKNFF